jgi:hypothetical protein
MITGQQIISSERQGASSALIWARGPAVRRATPAMFRASKPRACSSAHSSFGVVVMMVKLRILSPAGERQVSPQPGHAHQPVIGQCDRVRLLARRGLLPLEKVIEVMAGPCNARNLVIFSRARAVEPLHNALIVDPLEMSGTPLGLSLLIILS